VFCAGGFGEHQQDAGLAAAFCHQAAVENVLSCREKGSAKFLTLRISMAILMAKIAEEENI